MTAWYNWTTFDIIGDLAFGDSFHCLDDGEYHPFVRVIHDSPRDGGRIVALRYLGFDRLALLLLLPLARTAVALQQYTLETLQKRLALGAPRPDLVQPLAEKHADGTLSMQELEENARLFIIAGSETTASLLAGVTYLLLRNPDCLARLADEVRAAFRAEDDITLTSAGRLTYMLACLNEALRYYPPAATGFPRVTPPGGATIAGHYVPEKVSSSPSQCCVLCLPLVAEGDHADQIASRRPSSRSRSGRPTTCRPTGPIPSNSGRSASSGTSAMLMTRRTHSSPSRSARVTAWARSKIHPHPYHHRGPTRR
jgi:hypothetical protein